MVIQINDVIVDETEYYDALPQLALYVYYVTALYDSGESAPSNLVTICCNQYYGKIIESGSPQK